MKREIKVGLWAAVAAVAVAVVSLNALAYSHAYSMTHYIAAGAMTAKPEQLKAAGKLEALVRGVRIVRPVSDEVPSALDPACQALTIRREDGARLSAWFCERGEASPLVIIFHGYAKEKTFLLPEAKAFLELGASVLLVDFQGSGGSSGNTTTIGVREAGDVAAAVRYAKGRLPPHARVILYGQSMGAVAILKAVHDGAVAPDAVILEGVFDTLLNTVRNRFASMKVPSFPSAELLVFWGGVQLGFNGFSLRPVDYAKSVYCPLLVMHGSEDPRVSVGEARRVFEAAPGPRRFELFEGVAHESYVARYPEKWRQLVSAIMRR